MPTHHTHQPENIGSRIDKHTHACDLDFSRFDFRVNACRATAVKYYCVPSLVLIVQAVFLLERGQTDRQTDATERPIHAGGYAGVGNNIIVQV